MNLKRAIINGFKRSALNGTPKLTLIREYKKLYKLKKDEIEWILEACDFNDPPNNIDYSKFYNSNITKVATQIEHDDAQVYYIDNFLTKKDCQLLSGYIEKQATPVLSHSNGRDDDKRTRQENFRNSSTIIIDHRDHEFFQKVDKQIGQAMSFYPSIGEIIHGQKYEIGEYYKIHGDFFRAGEDFDTYCEWMGQRTWTTMLYLNDVEEGGETHFPELNLKVKPKEGTLLAWNNLHKDGTTNINTLHEALPPKSDKKYIITKLWRSWGLV